MLPFFFFGRFIRPGSLNAQVPRRSLNVLATSKGLFVGDVRFNDGSGNFVDGSRNPLLVPADVDEIRNLQSSADFILVVEKDATFQKLFDDGFLVSEVGPCVLVTGKGYPDVNTRELVKRLSDELSLPVYALVDADPHGIEILCVYKYGSLAMAGETDSLAVPSIRWLGVRPSHVQALPMEERLPLSSADKSKIRDLLSRPYILGNEEWKEEILRFESLQCKAEIQSLGSGYPAFLASVFIPATMRLGGWI